MATGNRIPRPNPLETPELSEFDDYGTTIRDWTSPWAGGKISAASLLRLAHRFLDFGIQEAHLSFLTYPRNLLLTDPDIASTKADGEWEAARLLGTGSYGAVGLWRKFTESRVITDEMAIKHVNLKGIGNIAKSTVSTHEGLLKEAIFMSNLNRAKDSHNVNILRQYQYNKPANLARFYMICCTHGDLSDIQERYMVWDTYLPENCKSHTPQRQRSCLIKASHLRRSYHGDYQTHHVAVLTNAQSFGTFSYSLQWVCRQWNALPVTSMCTNSRPEWIGKQPIWCTST